MTLLEEARRCRIDAHALADRPEGPLLLQLASAFEELAELRSQLPEAPGKLPLNWRAKERGRRLFFWESAG